MTISRDLVTGLALILGGVAIFLGARGFFTPASVAYGPAFFPNIIAVGLIFTGALTALTGLREAQPKTLSLNAPHLLRIGLLLGLIVLYALTLDGLGFHIATALLLFAATLLFGGSLLSAAVLAVISTLVLHGVFYSGMRVGLPWGLLAPYSW